FHVTGVQTCALPIWFSELWQVDDVSQTFPRRLALAGQVGCDGVRLLDAQVALDGVEVVPLVVQQPRVGAPQVQRTHDHLLTVNRSEERRVGNDWSSR